MVNKAPDTTISVCGDSQSLLRLIDSLQPDWWREAVTVFAVVGGGHTCKVWSDAVVKAGLHKTRGTLPTQHDLLKLLEHLADRGIVRKKGSRYSISPVVGELLAHRAAKADTYRRIRQACANRYGGELWDSDDGKDTALLDWLFHYGDAMRWLRNALYERRFVRANAIVRKLMTAYKADWFSAGRASAVFSAPFDPDHVECFEPKVRYDIVRGVMLKTALYCGSAPDLVRWLQKRVSAGDDPHGMYALYLGEHWLLKGTPDNARTLATNSARSAATGLSGCLLALDGRYEEAVNAFETALRAIRRFDKRRRLHLEGLCFTLHCASLLRVGTAESLRKLSGILHECRKVEGQLTPAWRYPFTIALQRLTKTGFDAPQRFLLSVGQIRNLPETVMLEQACAAYWSDTDGLTSCARELVAFGEKRYKAGFPLMASEALRLAAHVEGEDRELLARAREMRGALGESWIVDTFVRKASWELVLDTLERIRDDAANPASGQASRAKRHVWILTRGPEDRVWNIELAVQTSRRDGRWSPGRRIQVRAYDGIGDDERELLGEQDRRVAHVWESHVNDYFSASDRTWISECLAELAGHPHVFWDEDREMPIEIALQPPSVQVARDEKNITLTVVPRAGESTCSHRVAGANRIAATRFTPEQMTIARAIGRGLTMPLAAEKRLSTVLGAIAPTIPVESDTHAEVETVPADPRPVVRLFEEGGLLYASLHCRPGPESALMQPGKGRRVIITVREGTQVGYERDLQRESELAAPVETLIDTWLTQENEASAALEPADALELLLGLRELGEDIVVEWARGERLHVIGTADASEFKASIRGIDHWFELDGALRVDEGRVIQLAALMELIGDAPVRRFVKLDSGEYLALTKRLRRQLRALRDAGDTHGGKMRLAPAAGLWAGEVLEELVGSGECADWLAHTGRIRQAMSTVPALPPGFQCELRDYQLEGFQWLGRLAQAGLGACLADDMGLGKTIQALALLLSRARLGPALVVAPTSVCAGWRSETERFAPSLRVRMLGEGDRAAVVAEAASGDIVVASYGLLFQEQELLSSREWATVVLDEAQAIKNKQTRRSRAAMRLRAGFRLAMSGTPIENHLGELWSIMQFLNPGLLGSANDFAHRYVKAAGTTEEHESRRRLRRIVSPFVLRRSKAQVLEELPSKTEIVVWVEMGSEEAAFYEALRRDAVRELEDVNQDPSGGRMRILAAITRLRRACCGARILDAGISIPSAKLEAFDEKVDELVDNGHRALVFSQFVDHLSLLRQNLDKKNITYQYLDGSTPAADRARAVDAFQHGADPLFLISLRAGGFGLNLTAADYVFIMDPWWNPAVEDQASDRAHRIGQQRPVTIYRFVTKDAIEQKIIALHHEKRELAESVLDGAEGAARIAPDELLELLREAGPERGGSG